MKNKNNEKHGFLNVNILCLAILLLFIITAVAEAASDTVFQYAVPIYNTGNTAYLWIPPTCKQVRGLILLDQNGIEEPFGQDPIIRQACTDSNMAIVWFVGKSFSYFAYKSGADKVLLKVLEDLALESGYSEIKDAPLMPMGHSASTPFCWYVGYWNPNRTIAVLSIKGAYCGPASFDPTANVYGVPTLQLDPEYYEWPSSSLDRTAFWKGSINACLSVRGKSTENLFSYMLSFAHGHFDWTTEEEAPIVAMFIRKAAQYRLPAQSPLSGPVTLRHIDPNTGYLLDPATNHSAPIPYSQHPNPLSAFWYFDQEMANAITNYGLDRVGKKDELISVVQNGNLLDIATLGYAYQIFAAEDSNTLMFKCVGGYLTTMPPQLINQGTLSGHANTPITFQMVNGPGIQIAPDTFKIALNRAASAIPTDITFLAYSDGDANYRKTMQPCKTSIPDLGRGLGQSITFPSIGDQVVGTKSIKLNAYSSVSFLPVEYYVKYGPAQIEGNTLKFLPIPPRSRLPIRVSVVAYQCGRYKAPLYRPAVSVERTFLIWGCPRQSN